MKYIQQLRDSAYPQGFSSLCGTTIVEKSAKPETPDIIKRQFERIGNAPLYIFPRKILCLMGIIAALPIILIVRLLRPFILIRFGKLPNTRVGPFATCPELYLCERDKGAHKPSVDFFCCHKEKNCNSQLKNMWERVLSISDFVDSLVFANKLLPGYEQHLIPMPNENDFGGLLMTSRPHLWFTKEEERLGRDMLEQQGISLSKKFICLAARDSAYLKATHFENDWSYHDYRDADINEYIPAAEELAKKGFIVFRMGAIVAKPLSIHHARIIDYATTFRNDFLDIFLLSKCHFFFGAHSGMNSVPMIFRRPKAVTDVIPLHSVHTWMAEDLFIPKKLWLKKERRFLALREMVESGDWRLGRAEQYEHHGLEVINNTSEEISALAVEMYERLNGTWETTDEDKFLQQSFWKIFNKNQTHGNPVARIGAQFLRQNPWLLK